jgi:hypothetical protein
MAKIGDDVMIAHAQRRQDNTWLFTVCYTAHFTESDIGRRFDDSVRIGDADGGGYVHPVAFTATGATVFRRKRIVVQDGAFGATVRSDALCVSVRLHRRPDQPCCSFSYQSAGTRPLGPGTVSSTGRQSGGASSGPSA